MQSDGVLFERLRMITTDSLAGVLLGKGLRNQWLRGPKAMNADVSRTVGRAFTLRFVPLRENVPGALGGKLPVNRDAIEAMPPGCIAIADTRGETGAATFGDIAVHRMVQRGIAGIVTDGAVRDRKGLIESGMPIWTAAITAPPPAARQMLVDMGQPIACGSVAVFPGDVIVGDMDGVVVVPAGLAEEVAAEGAEQERRDAWQLAEVQRGVALPDIAPLPNK